MKHGKNLNMEKELNPSEELKPPMSRLALTAFILLCIPILFIALLIISDFMRFHLKESIFVILGTTSLLSLAASTCLGVLAHALIEKNKLSLQGKNLAGFVVIFSTFVGFILFAMPYGGRIKPIAQRLICETNLRGLATALTVYAADYQDKLPDNYWCDHLIQEYDVSPKSFICSASDLIEGECSYALNKHISSFDNVPPDLVLLFETKNSHQSDNMGPIKTREGFSKFSLLKELFTGKEVVALDCWNQKGGPELLSTANHDYQGCNIVFTDLHSKWVPYKDLPNLKWSIEDPTLHWIPEPAPADIKGNLLLHQLSWIGAIGCMLFGLIRLKKNQLVFCFLSGILSAMAGLVPAHLLEIVAYPVLGKPLLGYKTGMLWGGIAGILYAFWLIKNLTIRRDISRYYLYTGILTGITCAELTNATLMFYYHRYDFFSFGLACYSGLPAGAVMGLLLGNLFGIMVKSPKPNE
jgi:hypothetical protein